MAQLEPDSEFKALVSSATVALAQLDTEALEALVLVCQQMADNIEGAREKRLLDRNESSLAAFAQVIEASRANLSVLRQLGAMRTTRLDYGGAVASAVWPECGSEH